MALVEPAQAQCLLGLAQCDITPPVGIYHRMWGAATHHRAKGVHRPLVGQVLALGPLECHSDASDALHLVVLDHCLLWDPEMRRLMADVAAGAGIDPRSLLITFTHTHAAGLMDASRRDLPGGELIEPYLRELGTRLAHAVREARVRMRATTLTLGRGRCSLAAHRDFFDAESQQFVCGFNPDGPADDTVVMVRATDMGGQPVATLVNYACHPTTLAWENKLISPDFPGAMRELVEQATGAPCVFLQGASGDLGPREGFVGQPEVADRNGRQLGHAVLATYEALPPPDTVYAFAGPVVSGATLGTWSYRPLIGRELTRARRWQLAHFTVDLAYRAGLPTAEEVRAQRQRWLDEKEEALRKGQSEHAVSAHAMIERCDRQLTRLANLPAGMTFPMPVTLLRLGGLALVAVEGEHYQYLQRQLRERFPQLGVLVVTLCNGSRPGYLPTRQTYGQGIYQETIALLEAGALERLTDAIGERLTALG